MVFSGFLKSMRLTEISLGQLEKECEKPEGAVEHETVKLLLEGADLLAMRLEDGIFVVIICMNRNIFGHVEDWIKLGQLPEAFLPRPAPSTSLNSRKTTHFRRDS